MKLALSIRQLGLFVVVLATVGLVRWLAATPPVAQLDNAARQP